MNSNHKSRIQKSRNKLKETVGCSPRESPTVTWQKVDTGGEMFVIIFPKWFLPSGAPYIIMRHLSHFLDFHSSNCHRVASASLKRYNSFNSIDRRKSSQGIFSWAHFVFCKFKIFGRVFFGYFRCVSSDGWLDKIHFHIGRICRTSLHCVYFWWRLDWQCGYGGHWASTLPPTETLIDPEKPPTDLYALFTPTNPRGPFARNPPPFSRGLFHIW